MYTVDILVGNLFMLLEHSFFAHSRTATTSNNTALATTDSCHQEVDDTFWALRTLIWRREETGDSFDLILTLEMTPLKT